MTTLYNYDNTNCKIHVFHYSPNEDKNNTYITNDVNNVNENFKIQSTQKTNNIYIYNIYKII